MKGTDLPASLQLSDETRERHPHVVADRRALHRIPEQGMELPRTAAFIEHRLGELGLATTRPIEHGLVGVIEGATSGPTVLLRADMDGLPVTEEADHGYRSEHAGSMHACGHDTHMAMQLEVARRLVAEGVPRGRVKLLFQPGEEGHHGAQAMIEAGALEAPAVDVAYAQHIWASAPTGTVLVGQGPVMAAVDTVHIRITGAGTHAAMPHLGIDPLYCGAQVVTALQSVVTRNVDPLDPAVITVARFQAGTTHNVIPPVAELTASVRVFDDAVHDTIERRIGEVVAGVATALGCQAEIDYQREHRATVNDPEIARVVREEAAAIVGADNVLADQRTMGAEDVSDFFAHVPGAIAFVGGGGAWPHHHPRFDIDEDALAIGTELMFRVARRLLG